MSKASKPPQDIKTDKMVTTPERRMRDAAKRQREEAYWASKCGPVTVTQIPVDPGSDQG